MLVVFDSLASLFDEYSDKGLQVPSSPSPKQTNSSLSPLNYASCYEVFGHNLSAGSYLKMMNADRHVVKAERGKPLTS